MAAGFTRRAAALFAGGVALFAGVAVLAGTKPGSAPALPAASDAVGPPSRYGPLHLSVPEGAMRGLIILFSRGDGWSVEDGQAAARLAGEGAFVAGVDSSFYLAHIHNSAACNLMEGDAETLARQIEREHGTDRYLAPILAGAGAGGALAERVLALAPANSIAGTLAVDPEPSPAITALPCGKVAIALNGFWEIGVTPAWPAAAAATVAEQRRAGITPTVRTLSAGGTEAEHLLTLAAPHLGPSPEESDGVADLPLVELPSGTPGDMLAIVLSGDGGWRDIDKSIAETLRREGVSTVGFDSLRYFWSQRTPEGTARDLARVMRTYMARWHVRHVALVGYSFGADVLPFVYPRLPSDLRAHIDLLSLIGLATTADFEIRVTGWFGARPSVEARPMAPELARLPPGVVQCIYGAGDTEGSACPGLEGTPALVMRLAGGHHFDGDYQGLTRSLLQAWRDRIK